MKTLTKSTFIFFLLCHFILYTSENIQQCVNKLRTTYESVLNANEWEEALDKRNTRVALYFIFYTAQRKSFFWSDTNRLKDQLLKECKPIYRSFFPL